MNSRRHSEAGSRYERRTVTTSSAGTQLTSIDTPDDLSVSDTLNSPCTSRMRRPLLNLQRTHSCSAPQSLVDLPKPENETARSSTSLEQYWMPVMHAAKDGKSLEPRPQPQLQSFDAAIATASILRTASDEPPITKASLGELDLIRIINDAKLRHDLNFDREVVFRPNYDGRRGEEKKALARLYWDALTIELTTYFQHIRPRPNTAFGAFLSDVTLAYFRGQQIPRRLPDMIKSIAEILKTLVPSAEWEAVDRTLDVDLVMQQLENGVMDFIQLSEWLGALLKGSCSPQRDSCVVEMVDMMQDGIRHNSPRELIGGIEKLFGVLEMMKLDVANHQIKYLKLLMVNDTVDFEQKVFLESIAHEFEISQALDWYEKAVEYEIQEYDEGHTRIEVFARAVIDLVIGIDNRFPTTFVFDMDRLRQLHLEVRKHICETICREAFLSLAKRLGYPNHPPSDSYRQVLQRISDIGEPYGDPAGWSIPSERAALEVVRAVYILCNIEMLPSDEHVSSMIEHLQRSCDVRSDRYQDLESEICNELESIVDQELAMISNLTPLQILNHYEPTSLCERSNDHDDLRSIGQRIAHITTLHWRTWSPILYLKDRMKTEEDPYADFQEYTDSEAHPRTRYGETERDCREGRTEGEFRRTDSVSSLWLEDGEISLRGFTGQ